MVRGKRTTYTHTKSDSLLGLNQTLKRYTDNPEIGGGRVVAQCTKTYKGSVSGKHLTPFNELCDHGNLLKNPIILEGVVSGISAYVDSLRPETRTWTIANKLTVQLDDSWGDIGSATGQEVEGYTTELGTRRELQIDGSGYTSANPEQALFGSGSWVKTGAGASVVIGGRTPDYSAKFTENTNPLHYGNVWCFTDEVICVLQRGALSASEAATISTALQKVFDTATWSN